MLCAPKMSLKKVFITKTSFVGKRCWEWVKEAFPADVKLTDNCEEADYIFSIFHNQILTKEQLSGKLGKFNFHGGILPYYRGSCTINWAIANEESETGVTLHILDEGVDTGPIIDIKRIGLGDSDTSGSVYKKLEDLTENMFKDWFIRLVNGDFQAIKQNLGLGHLYRRRDIESIKDLTKYVRAFEHPGKESAYYYNESGEKIFLSFSSKKN